MHQYGAKWCTPSKVVGQETAVEDRETQTCLAFIQEEVQNLETPKTHGFDLFYISYSYIKIIRSARVSYVLWALIVKF